MDSIFFQILWFLWICLNFALIALNFLSWNAFARSENHTLKVPKTLSTDQNIYPIFVQVFVPRQRLVLARVTRDKIILYLYNLTRDTQDRLVSVDQSQASFVNINQSEIAIMNVNHSGEAHLGSGSVVHRQDQPHELRGESEAWSVPQPALLPGGDQGHG